ncbi:MAG: adenylyl-sulfate kinase [Deltaproteobacteria bacterium]|nr:adenylyl-sulfate kinase [Deltaproteobacteria bacterium]
MIRESKLRSIIKSLSWRLLATLTTILIVYIFVGNTRIAFSIGGIEVFLKMLVYFLHERLWEKIRFGRREIKPLVVWITGLSRSGKSGIGRLLTKKLRSKGYKAEHLDGHSIRDLFPETGYSSQEVNQHIRRVGFLARKLEEQGVIVVATFLSPYAESREFVRKVTGRYFEIYISTPAEVCAARDQKGVYSQAAAGVLENFPGINSEYEIPKQPELTIDTSTTSQEEAATIIFSRIRKKL